MRKFFIVLSFLLVFGLNAIAHAKPSNPITVPEPIASILFVTGGALLLIKRLNKKK